MLTLDIWTPRLRWTPEHSMQRSTPRFRDAQSGSGAPHSAHTSLPCTFLRTSIGFSCFELTLWCCELLPKRPKFPLAKFLSNDNSSIAKWSASDELLNELLSLAAWWWPLPVGLVRSCWNYREKLLDSCNICTWRVIFHYQPVQVTENLEEMQ